MLANAISDVPASMRRSTKFQLESLVSPGSRMWRGPWLRLLSELLELAGPQAQFVSHKETSWSSVTFTGARHVVVLAFNDVEAISHGEAYIAALPEHEFTIARHIVADAAVTAVEHQMTPAPTMTVEAELLLLEDY